MRIATDHREAILVTAARLFARKPFHEVLMDDVALQTGIAKGTIYRCFPNKEDLFAALSLRFLEQLTDSLSQQVTSDEPVENIRRMVVRMVEIIEQDQDFFRVMQRRECEVYERKAPEFLQRRTALRDKFAAQIRKGIEQGTMAFPFGAVMAADMLLGMVRNILRFSSPLPAPERIAEITLHMFENGVNPRMNARFKNIKPLGSKRPALGAIR